MEKELWGVVVVQQQSGDCTFGVVFSLNCLDFFSAVQGNHFLRHQQHALWRQGEYGIGKNNGRIQVVVTCGRKQKPRGFVFTTPAAGNPRRLQHLQACTQPDSSPWYKFPAADITGHADSWLLPVIPECRCFYHTTFSAGIAEVQGAAAALVVPVIYWQSDVLPYC